MNEEIWLPNVKHLRLSLKTSWALVFCIHTHVHTISKVLAYQENELCLPNKEYISYHKWERINVLSNAYYIYILLVSSKPTGFFLFLLIAFPLHLHILLLPPHNIRQTKQACLLCGESWVFYLVIGYRQHWVFSWYFEVSTSSGEVGLPAVAFMPWVPTISVGKLHTFTSHTCDG